MPENRSRTRIWRVYIVVTYVKKKKFKNFQKSVSDHYHHYPPHRPSLGGVMPDRPIPKVGKRSQSGNIGLTKNQ